VVHFALQSTGMTCAGKASGSCLLILVLAFRTALVEGHFELYSDNSDVILPTFMVADKAIIRNDTNCSLVTRLLEATRRRRTRWTIIAESDDHLLQAAVQVDKLKGALAYLQDQIYRAAVSGVGMSFFAGLSTCIGACIVFAVPGNAVSSSQMAFVLSLAGGVMLTTTILEFWLPVLTAESGEFNSSRVFLCSAIGVIGFLALSKLAPAQQLDDDDLESFGKASVGKDSRGEDLNTWRLALVMMFSLTMHNFPEGFAVGVSSLGGDGLASVVMIAIAIHNIPEGIAIAVPVLAATGSRKSALMMTFISGMAEPLGAVVALMFVKLSGTITEYMVENLLCTVGGVMLAVALKELLPEAWNYGKPAHFIAGAASGALVMLATILFGA
jgi:ZIP family zinc transporter